MILPSGNGARPEGCTRRQPYKDFRRTVEGEWGLISDLSWCDACFSYLRRQYHKSDRWQRKKRHAMHQFRGGECFVCPQDVDDVLPPEGHHRTYDHFGYERPDEIVPACRKHHELYSNEDAYREAAQRMERARMDPDYMVMPSDARSALTGVLGDLVEPDVGAYAIMDELATLLSFMLAKYRRLYWQHAEAHGADRNNVKHRKSVKSGILCELRFPLRRLGFLEGYEDEVPEDVSWEDVVARAPWSAANEWHEEMVGRLRAGGIIKRSRSVA